MVYVPAGRYWSSFNGGQWKSVNAFYIDRYEVSNAQYLNYSVKKRDFLGARRKKNSKALGLCG